LVESSVKIVVKDAAGEEIVFDESISGRFSYTHTVTGWETGTISVYVNDGLVDKISF
jgi:hypothetical protein